MKQIKFLGFCLAAAVMGCGFTSCDYNDDDNKGNNGESGGLASAINPATVLTAGLPTQIGDYAVTLNEKGQVATMKDASDTYTFTYQPVMYNGKRYDMSVMRIENLPEGTQRDPESCTYYLNINKKGFATYCYEVYYDAYDEKTSYDEWWFGYNSDNQLNYMKRTEGGNEVTEMTYTNGDITKVTVKSDEDPYSDVTEISYTTDKFTAPVANKAGIMLFDYTLDVDMDDMNMVYFAGILGKPTKNLPLRLDNEEGDFEVFDWTIDASGHPTLLKATTYDVNDLPSGTDTYTFTW